MEKQFILIAYIVNFGLLIFVQSLDHRENRAAFKNVNDGNKIQKNFQNLFDSLANSDIRETEVYHEVLKGEVAKERQAFDAMQEELRIVRNRNFLKKRNFNQRSNTVVTKREVTENDDDTETANDTDKSPFEQEREKAEELFIEIHDVHSLDSLKWDLAENITEERLEKVCRDVATAINPSNLTTYVPPTKGKPEERVVKDAPILFTASRYITFYNLINCTFEDSKFYLAPGEDDNHVFCLTWEMNHIYCFRSGLHEVHY